MAAQGKEAAAMHEICRKCAYAYYRYYGSGFLSCP